MTAASTHYEILKVTRDAPVEVIRSAYKAMAQKYHPDKNPGNADAVRMMKLVNVAYDILSDPQKKADYDLSLRRQETVSRSPPPPAQRSYQPPQSRAPLKKKRRLWKKVIVIGLLVFAGVKLRPYLWPPLQEKVILRSADQRRPSLPPPPPRAGRHKPDRPPCRPFVTPDGRSTGTACLMPDGTWQIKTIN